MEKTKAAAIVKRIVTSLILAPVVLNIFLVHSFLAPSGIPLALVLGLLMIYLSFFAPPYAPSIKQLFRRK
jgi:uncharacterized membrane protein